MVLFPESQHQRYSKTKTPQVPEWQQWAVGSETTADHEGSQSHEEPQLWQVRDRQIGTPYRVRLNVYLVVMKGKGEEQREEREEEKGETKAASLGGR